MSTPIKDGGPAFPCVTSYEQVTPFGSQTITTNHGGMSLRDWFAGQALAALVSREGSFKLDGQTVSNEHGYSAAAYYYADAMIAWREAKP